MRLTTHCLLALVALTAAPLLAQAHTASESAVLKADHDWEVVFSAKNLEKSVAAVAGHGAMAAPNAPLATGPAEVRALIKEFFATPSLAITWHATYVEVAKSEDMAFTNGYYDMSSTGSDGKVNKDHGKYVTVWIRSKKGRWLVQRDIFNSDLPLPGNPG